MFQDMKKTADVMTMAEIIAVVIAVVSFAVLVFLGSILPEAAASTVYSIFIISFRAARLFFVPLVLNRVAVAKGYSLFLFTIARYLYMLSGFFFAISLISPLFGF